MQDIENLKEHCVGMSIEYNEHKLVYQGIEEYLQLHVNELDVMDVDPSDWEQIVATDTIWEVRWYPRTPIGFNQVAAATLERALEIVWSEIKGEV